MKALPSKKQDENNVTDELKVKNCALEDQIDDLKNQLQSLQKRNETLEYVKRHYKQRVDELEGEHEKLLKRSNDCQSENKLLKSNYGNINYINQLEKMKINCIFTQGYQPWQYLI